MNKIVYLFNKNLNDLDFLSNNISLTIVQHSTGLGIHHGHYSQHAITQINTSSPKTITDWPAGHSSLVSASNDIQQAIKMIFISSQSYQVTSHFEI